MNYKPSVQHPVSIVYDSCDNNGESYALLGYICGDTDLLLGKLSKEKRKLAVTNSLVRFFGPKAGRNIGYIEKR